MKSIKLKSITVFGIGLAMASLQSSFAALTSGGNSASVQSLSQKESDEEKLLRELVGRLSSKSTLNVDHQGAHL